MANTLEQKPPIPIMFYGVENKPLNVVDLTAYIKNPNQEILTFSAEGGEETQALPQGITCTPEGLLQGTPAKGTARTEPYILVYTATGNHDSETLVFSNLFRIFTQEEYDQKLKEEQDQFFPADEMEIEAKLTNYWQNFSDKLPLPNLQEILKRKVTTAEVYYLLQRFATLTVWNGDDLAPANEGQLVSVEGISPRYRVYDFKVALVAVPKDLYDPDRTMGDSIQTAKALIHEARNRGWNIELAGFDKMVTAAWVEVQNINKVASERQMQVYNYQPTFSDYTTLAHVSLNKPLTPE